MMIRFIHFARTAKSKSIFRKSVYSFHFDCAIRHNRILKTNDKYCYSVKDQDLFASMQFFFSACWVVIKFQPPRVILNLVFTVLQP